MRGNRGMGPGDGMACSGAGVEAVVRVALLVVQDGWVGEEGVWAAPAGTTGMLEGAQLAVEVRARLASVGLALGARFEGYLVGVKIYLRGLAGSFESIRVCCTGPRHDGKPGVYHGTYGFGSPNGWWAAAAFLLNSRHGSGNSRSNAFAYGITIFS